MSGRNEVPRGKKTLRARTLLEIIPGVIAASSSLGLGGNVLGNAFVKCLCAGFISGTRVSVCQVVGVIVDKGRRCAILSLRTVQGLTPPMPHGYYADKGLLNVALLMSVLVFGHTEGKPDVLSKEPNHRLSI